VKKRPFLVPLGIAIAAALPQGAQAKIADAGQGLGQAQAALVQSVDHTKPALLALPADDPVMAPFTHYSHSSHTSHASHHSHYSSSGGGGHYSHSSHSSHSSHYSGS
jgi:hypothetical protein